MAEDFGALTNMWMLNPWMFDPSQNANQFSPFQKQPIPFPPTYNTGPAGGVMNAATGKPIASFQAWQAANPAGMSINATPAQPQAPAASSPSGLDDVLAALGMTQQGQQMAAKGMSPQDIATMIGLPGVQNIGGPQAAPQAAQAAAPQASGAPNNWYAALNALANPGNPVTPGATVPMAQGFQPAGGVNQAFLNQVGGGGGGNQNFLSALAAIQGRPQGTQRRVA